VTFGCPFDPGTEPPVAGTSGAAGTGAGSGATAGASGSGNVLRPPDFFAQDAGTGTPSAKLPLTTIEADPIDCGCHLAGSQGSAARTLALLPALALLVRRMRSRRSGSNAARRER
jgi:hypothetical protein